MNTLYTDFGHVYTADFVPKRDLEGFSNCAKRVAQEAWEQGVEPEPLSLDKAMTMPEWNAHLKLRMRSMNYD